MRKILFDILLIVDVDVDVMESSRWIPFEQLEVNSTK